MQKPNQFNLLPNVLVLVNDYFSLKQNATVDLPQL